jgi:hypothetical protein
VPYIRKLNSNTNLVNYSVDAAYKIYQGDSG